MKNLPRHAIILPAVVIVTLLALFLRNSGDEPKESVSPQIDWSQADFSATTETDKVSVNYEILDQSVYAPDGQKFYVLVPTGSEKIYVQLVAEELVSKFKNESAEITIYFWDDERNYETGSGYNVGAAEWNGGEVTYKWKEKQNIADYPTLTEPTIEELAIFDYYWAAFDEAGNPRGYTVHPTVVDSYTNKWEIERVDRVTSKYKITRDELFEIVMNVSNWQDLH